MSFTELVVVAFASEKLHVEGNLLTKKLIEHNDQDDLVLYLTYCPSNGMAHIEANAASDPACIDKLVADVIRSGVLGNISNSPSVEFHQRADKPVVLPTPQCEHSPLYTTNEALELTRALDAKIAELAASFTSSTGRGSKMSMTTIQHIVMPALRDDFTCWINERRNVEIPNQLINQQTESTILQSTRLH